MLLYNPGVKKFGNYEIASIGAGEMAQWLRALGAVVEGLGSVCSTHMVAKTGSSFNSRGSNFSSLRALYVHDTLIHMQQNTQMHNKIVKMKQK